MISFLINNSTLETNYNRILKLITNKHIAYLVIMNETKECYLSTNRIYEVSYLINLKKFFKLHNSITFSRRTGLLIRIIVKSMIYKSDNF